MVPGVMPGFFISIAVFEQISFSSICENAVITWALNVATFKATRDLNLKWNAYRPTDTNLYWK